MTIAPINNLPSELLTSILIQAGNPKASSVNRRFRHCNGEAFDQIAEIAQSTLETNETIAAYLSLPRAKLLSPAEKLKWTHKRMADDLSTAQLESNSITKVIFKNAFPKLFIPHPPRVDFISKTEPFIDMEKQMKDFSLQKAWSGLREGILLSIPEPPRPFWQEWAPVPQIPGMPNENAPVQEIRDWLAAERNQALIQNVTRLDLKRKQLVVIPEELKRFSGVRTLDLSCNQIRILPPDLLSAFPHLEEISLNENQLETIPPNFFQHTRRLEVHLWLNPLQQLGDPGEAEVISSECDYLLKGMESTYEHMRNSAASVGIPRLAVNAFCNTHYGLSKGLFLLSKRPFELLAKTSIWQSLY